MSRAKPGRVVIAFAVLFVCFVLAIWGLDKQAKNNHEFSRGLARLTLELKAEQTALKASVQSPTHSKDIQIWCGFDQAIDAALHAYIGQFGGHAPPLKLPSLDCKTIEAGEAASSHTKK